ncbi:MAG: 3-oxoacyl-[acyl-carrier-protein] synthase II [Pseudohongiellaceae bacterium]|jgi:3-oxoacyl-[acyl-carrier-protein] synthase II
MGIVSAFAGLPCYTKEQYWNSIREGISAVTDWQPEGCDDFPVRYAAAINFAQFKTDHQQMLAGSPLLERRGYFGLAAALHAYKDARLDKSMSIGCAVCSGVPDISDNEMLALQAAGAYPESLQTHQPTDMSGLACSNDRMVSAIAEKCDITGPVLNINGACAGAAQALGMAYRAIRRGEVDVVLAGGADSVLNTRVMSGLFLLGATATTSPKGLSLCCPFDKQRSGLVAGEGGAFLVLESESSAKARGATIYAEVIGYGSSLDAYKITAPHPEGQGAKAAMLAAMNDAQIQPQDIDYINAHGTSTPLNDQVETHVIKDIFSACQDYPLVSSTKSMIGHWISAAAAPEAMATVLGIYHGVVPPTINLMTPDSDCDLDYVSHCAREKKIRYALSNSFGFGGINACLAFGAYDGR